MRRYFSILQKITVVLFYLLVLSAIDLSAQTPVANFTSNTQAGCSPLIVSFQDLSTGNPTSWSWDLGNGNTSTLQNPTASYFTAGTYTIKLTVTNASGTNTLTRTQYITVYDAPAVNFSANNTSGCFPLRVQFTDLSNAGAGNTDVSWNWDLGNGTTSTQQDPFVTYTTAGVYSVTLKVTNDKGCVKTITIPNYINVTPGVIAAFNNTQPTVCQPPANIFFTNTSSGPGTLTYVWDFGDGNTSTITNPSNIYTSSGSYTVTLVATSSIGCTDTLRRTNTVTIGGITTSFTAPDSICVNEPINLINTSSPSPAASNWSFGDATSSTQINPLKIYTTPGLYTIRLVNTYANCQDSAFKNIKILSKPVANFSAPVTTKCEPSLTVNFQDLSVNAVSWLWNFGDGNTSNAQNPSHTYTNYGSYNVSLIITNASGCSDTIQKNQFVKITRAVITIPSLPMKGCIPFVINPIPNITALDAVTSYAWDFGDGSSSTLANPSHTYSIQGTYTVKLVITTSSGCADSLTIPAAVTVGSKPTADFSATPNPVCAFQPVQFTDLSTPANQWQWQFGDGGSSVLQNPSYTYTDTGSFSVTLIVTNNGCPDTAVKSNYITVLPPIARFAAGTNCANRLQFTFSDQSIGATGWQWDFGDGNTSTAQNPVHSFPGLGSFNVTLTVTNGTCSHSVSHTINTIQQSPDFFASATTICRGVSLGFQSINLNTSLISSYLWNLGNGHLVTGLPAFSYTYPASGTYPVSLITTDINGCKDTIIKTNYIRVNGPLANFSAANTSGCKGLTTTFNDLSTTDGVNSIVNKLWDFGDGNTQIINNPPYQHIYNIAGTYSVKLKITDASGCSDSLSTPNLVTATDPLAGFISADTLSCPGATVNFTNSSSAIGFTSLWDFGDGNSSTATSPMHVYTSAGQYDIKLHITDAYGCADSLTKNLYINIDKPVASFTINDTATSCTPFQANFTNTSHYFVSSLWDFSGGTSALTNPVHYYNIPGTYNVQLIVTSHGGCKDTTTTTVTVYDTTGTNINYLPVSGCKPLIATFSAFTPGPVSYLWDFGDGNLLSTTSPNITHQYTSFGNFIPKVILTDPTGCLIPVTGAAAINVIGANAKFGWDKTLFCDSGYVHFSDSTTSNDLITNYNWNFGDGSTSNLQMPTHQYTSPGIYSISLDVLTQSGCRDTAIATQIIKVVQSPLITITGDSVVCINGSMLHNGVFLRTDTSAVSWQWNFPNGNQSASQNPPPQTYTTAGNFFVTSVATNSSGCSDTAIKNIIVFPLPVITMPGTITMIAGYPVQIPATYSSNVINWNWSPSATLNCSTCPQPEASPKFNTSYTVNVTDSNGCQNSASVDIIVICKNANVFVPNTFSPNGDGSNDIFYPRGRGINRVKSLRIYNRWGEMVFDKNDFPINDPSAGWDGTYKGKKPIADVYVYQVEIYCDNGDIIHFDGNVSLIL